MKELRSSRKHPEYNDIEVNPFILAMGTPMDSKEREYYHLLGQKLKNPLAEWISPHCQPQDTDLADLTQIKKGIQEDYGLTVEDILPTPLQGAVCSWEKAARDLSEQQESKRISSKDFDFLQFHPNWECLFSQYKDILMYDEKEKSTWHEMKDSLSNLFHLKRELLKEDLHIFWMDCEHFRNKHKYMYDITELFIFFNENHDGGIEIQKDMFYYKGIACEYGIGTEKNAAEACSAYERQINNSKKIENSEIRESSYRESCYRLALIHNYVRTNHLDPINVIDYYRIAANKNHAMAQYRMGSHYETSQQDQNFPLAFEWYSKAADQNLPLAQYMVGRCFASGLGTEKNLEKAFQFYLKAAKQEHVIAQYAVSCCYKEGIGTPANEEQFHFYYGKVWTQLMKIYSFKPSSSRTTLAIDPFTAAMGTKIDIREAIHYYVTLAEDDDNEIAQLILFFYSLKGAANLIHEANLSDYSSLTYSKEEADERLESSAEKFLLAKLIVGLRGLKTDPEKSSNYLNQAMECKEHFSLVEPWLKFLHKKANAQDYAAHPKLEEIHNKLKRKYEGTGSDFPPNKKAKT